MSEETTPQDGAAMPPASTGSLAERPLGDPEIAVEILRLRVAELEQAIRRIAEQDATLSVCDGAVTVQMDATLTDAERELLHKMRVHLYEISRDNAFIDDVCDDAKASYVALSEFLGRHG